jgi:tetratricopeptide (TPR) repeat protein
LVNRGILYREMGRPDEAMTAVQDAAKLWNPGSNRSLQAFCSLAMGSLLCDRGEVGRGLQMLEEGVETWHKIHSPRGLGASRFEQALAVLDRDERQAENWLHESVRVLAGVGAQSDMATSLEALAELVLRRGEPSQSMALLAAAESLRSALGAAAPARLRQRIDAARATAVQTLGAKTAEAIAKRWANATAAQAAALAEEAANSRSPR